MLSALPFVGSMIAGLAGGIVADKMHRCISIASVRKIFQVTGSWGFAIPMLVVTWLMDINHRLIAVMLLVLAVTLLNLTSLAYRINCLDIAPRYASFITSLSFTIATAASLTAPVVTSAILVEKSNEEWKIVLYIVSAVSFAGGLFYLFFARGEVQSWALENTFDITVIVPDPAPAAAIQREMSVSDFTVDKDRNACLVLSVNPLNSLQ
ncbi:hypothetical protein V1264_003910 [Littorina saxatilis]|uniref:Uncharacterized protein n=2 Tax=Littorina saxatilis TaxID=31220 RepID=A0AAN9B314_9CAEN